LLLLGNGKMNKESDSLIFGITNWTGSKRSMYPQSTTAEAYSACNTSGLSGKRSGGRNFVSVPGRPGFVTGPEEKELLGGPFFGQSDCGKA
jgi:hypothetical protein